jgi:hypothetical protein
LSLFPENPVLDPELVDISFLQRAIAPHLTGSPYDRIRQIGIAEVLEHPLSRADAWRVSEALADTIKIVERTWQE